MPLSGGDSPSDIRPGTMAVLRSDAPRPMRGVDFFTCLSIGFALVQVHREKERLTIGAIRT